jgi:hypothetical protein
MINSIRKHPAYRVILFILLLASLIFLFKLNQTILNEPGRISSQDFSQFWASGRLNFDGENPYNPILINELKNEISGISEEPAIVSIAYNPPWLMPLLMGLSWIPFSISRLIWLLMNLAILLFCAVWLWGFYEGDRNKRWFAILVVVTFGSVFLVLRQGQITPLLLLGIVGFLDQTENKKNYLLAGFFAALISIKPQLFYLFWIALLFWVIYYRRWMVLVGFLITIAVATLISLLFNPDIIFQYIEVLMNYSPRAWMTPTLGTYLRMLLGVEKFWLQFVAPIIGGLWFLWYWRMNYQCWSWKAMMPDLIFVSLLTVPYGWTYDLVLLILPILYMFIKVLKSNQVRRIRVSIATFLIINLIYLIMMLEFKEQFFGWYIVALFLWFWMVKRSIAKTSPVVVSGNS